MGAPRRRGWLYGLAAAGAIVLSLALGIAWLVTTPGGARLLMDRLATAMGEGVKVTGVEGSLSDVLRVKLIEVHRPDLVIVIQDLLIERSPGSAWFAVVSFKRVEAALIDVRTASSGAAARVPLTFEAPYALRVESTRVGELRIGTLTKEGNPPPPVIVKELVVLGGEGDKKSWRLEKGEATTPWGRAAVAGSLATTRPFALDLRGEIAGEREGVPYRASARLGGTLEKIEAKVEAEARALRVTGTALVEPFDKHPLRALKAQARDVDIAAFGAGPHTRLSVDADLTPSGDGFAGPVHLANALAGSLDAQKIPVASAEARIAWMPRGEAHELDVSDARLALEGGGTAHGSARWMPGRLEAKVTLADLDTARIHARMRSTRVGGTISVVSEGGGQRFEVALADPKFKLEGHATLANARLEIPTIRVKHEGGAVEGKGFLGLAQHRDFRFEGRAEHFDPSAFVGRVKGDLNFEFVASGALEPALSGDVRLDIAQSRLAENAFVGNVHVAGDAQRIANADVRVSLGDAHFQANGSFGRTGDAMQVALQAPNLGPMAKVLELEVSGKLDARGTLTGTFAAPGGRFEIAGANLALPGGFYTVGLNARGEIATAADGKVDASIDGTTITRRSGDAVQALADHATITVQGTRAAHKATLVAALSKESELRASVQGGLDPKAAKPAWRGELAALSLTGPSEFSLASSAPLAVAADRVELGDATIKGSWGEAHFALSRWTPELLELRGAASGVGVRNLARTLRLQTIPRGSLTIAAEWDLKAGDTVDGFVSISRASGDLRIGDPPRPLGLEELKLRAEANRGQAKILVNLRSQLIGKLDGEASGRLQHIRAGFGIERDAPIAGRVDAQVDSFAWAAAWMGPEARAEGKANAHVTISGTLAEPRWNGRVDADGVSIREPQSGFEVEKGVVAVTASDRSLVVEKFSASTPWHPSQPAIKAMEGFARPESGTLEASGSIDLRSRLGTVVIKATSVPVTQLNTRFLALSGDVKLEARADDILATGTLRADAGWIGALATPLPSVSDDVVVVRKSVPAEERKRERVRIDVRFSLGDHLSYTGRGLDTKLQGDLRIQGELGSALRGNGVIRTAAGTYEAYGRKLTIEHGTLTFFGSLENPALDVLALRKGLPVEAGVEVRGNVSRPRARLVSSPDVPEQEKVSWLVLGRGPSDVSQSEAATLASAANAILGRTSGAQQITQQLGVDEVKVGRSEAASVLGVMPQNTVAGRTGSGSASDVVTVGKKLTKDIYVAYERGLADAEDTLRITWQITHQFQMLVRAGYLPGVDAVYRWTFE